MNRREFIGNTAKYGARGVICGMFCDYATNGDVGWASRDLGLSPEEAKQLESEITTRYAITGALSGALSYLILNCFHIELK